MLKFEVKNGKYGKCGVSSVECKVWSVRSVRCVRCVFSGKCRVGFRVHGDPLAIIRLTQTSAPSDDLPGINTWD